MNQEFFLYHKSNPRFYFIINPIIAPFFYFWGHFVLIDIIDIIDIIELMDGRLNWNLRSKFGSNSSLRQPSGSTIWLKELFYVWTCASYNSPSLLLADIVHFRPIHIVTNLTILKRVCWRKISTLL